MRRKTYDNSDTVPTVARARTGGKASGKGAQSKAVSSAVRSTLRVGFIDLIDAAPLIVAHELGYFGDDGLHVALERQLGWGNIRDKLTYGQLDASHALLGMPVFSHLHRDWFSEPLVALMNLGSGGNAITLSDRLIKKGVRSGGALGTFIRNDPKREALVFAHVFGCSMHHYLLRDWLAASGINPDADVRLRVFPPNQLASHMANGNVDGFCVGEPWNTLADRKGIGSIVAVTADIAPSHPEKVLAVSTRWMKSHDEVLPKLIRALLRACAFCDDEANWPRVSEMLGRPQYIDVSPEVIAASLKLEATFVAGNRTRGEMGQRVGRDESWRPRSFAPATTFPSRTHMGWLIEQMIRWSHAPADIDVRKIADRCTDSSAYRNAAESLGIACPADEYPPMALRNGRTYEVPRFAVALQKFDRKSPSPPGADSEAFKKHPAPKGPAWAK